MTDRRDRYIPTLDGWRAVAILAVMLYHDRIALFGPSGLFPQPGLEATARAGAVGVHIFFALSGFLITSRLLAERETRGRIDLKRFYIRRCFRILPPYWGYLAAVALLATSGLIAVGGREFLSCLLFYRNYFGEGSVWTRHFWTLAVEEHFYLIWPGLMVLAATIRRARGLALALAGAVIAWRALDTRYRIAIDVLGLPIRDPGWRTDLQIDRLFLGCWMALALDDPAWRGRLARLLSPLAWPLFAAGFVAACYAPMPWWARDPAYSILIPLMLVGTVLHPDAPPGRVLEWGPLRWIGRLSYSLYLWQQLFLTSPAEGQPLGRLQTFPLNWLAAFGCALASYHLVEQPMIALGRRLSARGRA